MFFFLHLGTAGRFFKLNFAAVKFLIRSCGVLDLASLFKKKSVFKDFFFSKIESEYKHFSTH